MLRAIWTCWKENLDMLNNKPRYAKNKLDMLKRKTRHAEKEQKHAK